MLAAELRAEGPPVPAVRLNALVGHFYNFIDVPLSPLYQYFKIGEVLL